MRYIVLSLSLSLCLVVLLGPAVSQASSVDFTHSNVRIIGKEKRADKTYDIDIAAPQEVTQRIKEAIDILRNGSPFTAQAIDKLAAAGNVIILYDPAFPQKQLSTLTIAAFFPDFFRKDGSAKDFVTVVGRYGGKWTARDLAPVIAHELTGHGVQHLRGRLDHVRQVDLECEAYMYQEKAYQDLGFDKKTQEIITFRQQLERYWCQDFRTWQKNNSPETLAYWDQLNPDIPKLLSAYLDYTEALKQSGVAHQAISRARAARASLSQEQIRALASSDDPADMYQLARSYMRGIGVEKDANLGAKWLTEAARRNHPRAQFDLSHAHWHGAGVPQNRARAADWARRSAELGHPPAAYYYGAMLLHGEGVDKDPELGKQWMQKSADAGYAKAREALIKLGVASPAN